MDRMRRRLLQGASATLALVALPAGAALTPRQSAGPFYPEEPPLDDDSDLVHVAGAEAAAKGQTSHLSGRLLDPDGRAVRGTRIEIWQCDVNGRYRHSRDPGRRPIDPGFQGFGHAVTDDKGRYRFLTIRPVPYPGRTPHIHVAVSPAGAQPFVTQLYVAGEGRNESDFLYRRIPAEQRGLVTAVFAPSTTSGAELAATWDIVIGAT